MWVVWHVYKREWCADTFIECGLFGTFIRGSGVADTFIECGLFGTFIRGSGVADTFIKCGGTFIRGSGVADTFIECGGTFIRGSGVADTFIECGLFGPKSVERVIYGSHYYRSFDGIVMLAEAIERLRFEAFWDQTDKNTFKEIGQKFSDYYKSLHEMNKN